MREAARRNKKDTRDRVSFYKTEYKIMTSAYIRISWCRWPDSNRHGLPRRILSAVRLPIPSHRRLKQYIRKFKKMQVFF